MAWHGTFWPNIKILIRDTFSYFHGDMQTDTRDGLFKIVVHGEPFTGYEYTQKVSRSLLRYYSKDKRRLVTIYKLHRHWSEKDLWSYL